jgi:hypothetical protein
MIRALTTVFGPIRLQPSAFLLFGVVAVASCDGSNPVASSSPSDEPGTTIAADNPASIDSAASSLVPSLATSFAPGIPYGPVGLWSGTDVKWGPKPFSQSQNSDDANGVVTRINYARSMGQRLVLNLTGGPSTNYTTNGKFDMTKWKNEMNTYKTSTIKNAVAAGVSDGTIIGNMLIDEPETPKWGGVITKPILDQMATYAKQIFPTLPVGLNHGPPGYKWRNWERYKVVDYVLYQYNYWITTGNVTSWRDAVLYQAKLDGVTPALSVNLLNGGREDRSGTWDCNESGQAGVGTRYPNCRMTSDQLRSWGKALTPYGCFMLMWRYDGTYMSKSANQDAFKDIAALAATKARRSCKRP